MCKFDTQITWTLTWFSHHKTSFLGVSWQQRNVVKTFIAIYIVRVHASWCVQYTFYISTDRLAAEKKYSHVVSQSIQLVYPSFLGISTCESLECLYNSCIIFFMWSILQSPIYLKHQSKNHGHTCVHWPWFEPFHFWNGIILFMPNMKSLCLVDQRILPMRFFYHSNWQIHGKIGQNLHAFENCPFHGHIQIIFVWIIQLKYGLICFCIGLYRLSEKWHQMLNNLINIYFNVQFVKLTQQGEEMGKTFENTT